MAMSMRSLWVVCARRREATATWRASCAVFVPVSVCTWWRNLLRSFLLAAAAKRVALAVPSHSALAHAAAGCLITIMFAEGISATAAFLQDCALVLQCLWRLLYVVAHPPSNHHHCPFPFRRLRPAECASILISCKACHRRFIEHTLSATVTCGVVLLFASIRAAVPQFTLCVSSAFFLLLLLFLFPLMSCAYTSL